MNPQSEYIEVNFLLPHLLGTYQYSNKQLMNGLNIQFYINTYLKIKFIKHNVKYIPIIIM